MTEVDAGLVRRKLAAIARNLEDLATPSAGLRNRLVHEYDRIEDALVLAAVSEARRSFAEYAVSIEGLLAREGL